MLHWARMYILAHILSSSYLLNLFKRLDECAASSLVVVRHLIRSLNIIYYDDVAGIACGAK